MHDLTLSTDGRGSLGYGVDQTALMRQTVLPGPTLFQLRAAQSGRVLTDYRQAEQVNLFTIPVATNAEANLKAAFWAAVAAQIQPQSAGNLIAIAQRRYAAGAALAFNRGELDTTGQAVAILQDAAREIAANAYHPQVRGIVEFLNDMGQSDVVLRRMQTDTGAGSFQQILGGTTQFVWIGLGLFTVAFIFLSRRE